MVKPYQILVIEDDPEHAELIRRGFLKHDEFFLDFAVTGEEGLEMIARKPYDLISVDLVLPGIGGLDVLVKIRKLDPDLPVVMVSGHGTTEMAVVAFENRATKYVVKSMESFRSLPYIFENLIQEARFKVSERRMQEQKERSEKIHRNVVENALAGIYILQDGVFKLANPKLGEIFGCSSQALLGTPFWQLVKPDDMECVSKLEYDQGGPAPVYESRIIRKDGGKRWIEFRTVPVEYDGRRAILGNLIDITYRKEHEMELAMVNRELAAINSILMRTLQAKGDMDNELGDALSDLASGIENLKVGGLFLREEGGPVLRALFGPIEEIMHFVNGNEFGKFLGAPKIHESENNESGLWASVPIICSDRAQGAIVVAPVEGDSTRLLSFLEKAASHIGRLVEACSMQSRARQTTPILRSVHTENVQD